MVAFIVFTVNFSLDWQSFCHFVFVRCYRVFFCFWLSCVHWVGRRRRALPHRLQPKGRPDNCFHPGRRTFQIPDCVLLLRHLCWRTRRSHVEAVGKTAIIVIDFDCFLPPTDGARHRYSTRSNVQFFDWCHQEWFSNYLSILSCISDSHC